MIRYLFLSIVLLITGCASFGQSVANYYNSQDPCQNYHQQQNYQLPDWCGSYQERAQIYDSQNRKIGTVR